VIKGYTNKIFDLKLICTARGMVLRNQAILLVIILRVTYSADRSITKQKARKTATSGSKQRLKATADTSVDTEEPE